MRSGPEHRRYRLALVLQSLWTKFIFKALACIAFNALCANVAAEIPRALLPANIAGQLSILDATLSFPQRLLRASILSGTLISIIYFMIEVTHYTIALFFVNVLCSATPQNNCHPCSMHPGNQRRSAIFWDKDGASSCATTPFHSDRSPSLLSLRHEHSLWRRSHHRRLLVHTSDKAGYAATRTKRGALSILGAFFLSGVLYDIALRSQGKGGKPIQMIGFFVLYSPVRTPPFWHKVVGHVWVLA